MKKRRSGDRPALPSLSGVLSGSLALVMALGLSTACSSIHQREQERLSAYHALSPAAQVLVSHGKVEPGMDTNAVWMAWCPPSQVLEPLSSPPQTVWIYYGNRPVLVPDWSFLPTDRGYWSLEYTPQHYSQRYTKAEVVFQNGRVSFLWFRSTAARPSLVH